MMFSISLSSQVDEKAESFRGLGPPAREEKCTEGILGF